MKLDKFLGMLGLAMRAGRVVIGFDEIAKATARSKIHLVILSSGASEGTKKKIRTKCEFYNLTKITVDVEGDELGRRLGKTSTPVCLGITDEGFAETLIRLSACED